MTNKVQIGLRVTEEMQKELKDIAESENRSVNNLIEFIIEQYLRSRDPNIGGMFIKSKNKNYSAFNINRLR